jgi:hypothetical protein
MIPSFTATATLSRDLAERQDVLHKAVMSSVVHRLGISIGESGIGPTGDSQPIYLASGLEATVSYKREGLTNRWAIHSTGSFWTEIEFFELNRTEGAVNGASRILTFFDFIEFVLRLYTNLGISPSEHIFLNVGHRNLEGVSLWKYSDMFVIYDDRKCHEESIFVPAEGFQSFELQTLQSDAAELAALFMNPFFMLFGGLQVPLSTFVSLLNYYRTGRLS